MWNGVVAERISVGRSLKPDVGRSRKPAIGRWRWSWLRDQTYELSPNSLRGVSKHQAGWVTPALPG
jgi:hypothetical protein